MNKRQESARRLSEGIALLSSERINLLSLCLTDLEAIINELEIEGPTLTMKLLAPISRTFPHDITLHALAFV